MHGYGIGGPSSRRRERPEGEPWNLLPVPGLPPQWKWLAATWGTSDNNRRARIYTLTAAGSGARRPRPAESTLGRRSSAHARLGRVTLVTDAPAAADGGARALPSAGRLSGGAAWRPRLPHYTAVLDPFASCDMERLPSARGWPFS